MAYLKGSRVTGLSPKPLDVKGFTQSTSEDLGDRLYSEHEVLLADAYKIVGDVTISDNLILTKLSDDGNAITVTGDASATRTISGSGSLEGSTFAQTPNASMTGMTGVVGSGVTLDSPTGTLANSVTGSPALNLGNTTGLLPSGVINPNHSRWSFSDFSASGFTTLTGWTSTTINLVESGLPTQSSGVFTFPTTGFWEIKASHTFYIGSSTAVASENISIYVDTSTNSGSSFTDEYDGNTGSFYCPANDWFREQLTFQTVVDVTNISTFRVRFRSYVYGSQALYQQQNGPIAATWFRKLGET